MKSFVKFCGKVIFWAVVVFGLVVGAALVLVMRHLDEAVRAEVQKMFAAHYDDLHVAVRSAQRVVEWDEHVYLSWDSRSSVVLKE